MSARRWWLPSVSVIVWLVSFLALNLTAARVKMIGADSDPCWHWRQGDWMLQHHAVLRTELFSHTRPGAPLVDLWWLSEIVTALAGRSLGWGGIVLVASTVCATIVWLLHRRLLAEGNDLLLSTVLTLLTAAVCATHWLARPHLATQFLVLVFAWQLRWFERGRTSVRVLLVLLPVLTALWANLHGAFVFAFVLIGVHLTGTGVSWARATADQRPALRHRTLTLAALLVACFLASLLNPVGWRLPAQVVRDMSSPLFMGFAQEYVSPNFHDPSTLPFILVVVVALLMSLIVRPRLTATDALLLIVWLALSLRMVRNAPLFALVATPILAEHWNAYLRAAPSVPAMQRFRRISANFTATDQMAGARALPAIAVVAMMLVLAKPQLLGGQPVWRTELPADKFPVDAVEFVRRSPDAVPGQMFNDYTWGGYLIWALPERKVFIHPHLDVYGEQLVRDFNEVDDAKPGWERVLRQYDVGWTILPREHPLNHVLSRRSDWKSAYADNVAVIYRRQP